MTRRYSAKILLFGEYTVIRGGQALALPYPAFSGEWTTEAVAKVDWNPLIRFLLGHPELEIDVKRLEQDIERGGGFRSTIPQGKGLGSSGALVAGLLAAYGPQREWSLSEAHARLAGLEACYHGQSSGVDPLVSWIGKPLLLNAATGPQVVDMPVATWSELDRWFLLDSGVARHSAPLVAVFKQKTENPDYKAALEYMEALVGEGIEAYEHLDEAMMGVTMEALSHLQFASFEEMIPPGMRAIWAHGLETREYALKLCGAGGGGYFLGYRLKSYPSGSLKF